MYSPLISSQLFLTHCTQVTTENYKKHETFHSRSSDKVHVTFIRVFKLYLHVRACVFMYSMQADIDILGKHKTTA